MNIFIFLTVLSAIVLPWNEFSRHFELHGPNPSGWTSLPQNFIHQVSFSDIDPSNGLAKFSGSVLKSRIEDLTPEQVFENLDSHGELWINDMSVSQAEDLLDKIRFVMQLQMEKHTELLSRQEVDDEIEESVNFINKFSDYMLLVVTGILNKKQTKFERDSFQIASSGNYLNIQLFQRDIHFLKELEDFVRNLYFFLGCKTPLLNNSALCKYLTKVYSDTHHKFLSKSGQLNEAYQEYENSFENIDTDDESKPKKTKKKSRQTKKKSRKFRFVYRSKAKNVLIRTKRN